MNLKFLTNGLDYEGIDTHNFYVSETCIHEWDNFQEIKKSFFLRIPEHIFEEIFTAFEVEGVYDYYDISNYAKPEHLKKLKANLEKACASFQAFNTLDAFRKRFSGTFDYTLTPYNFGVPDPLVESRWQDFRDDLIALFRLIQDKRDQCLKENKVLIIFGI